MSVLTFTSGGRFFCKSFKDASNLSVNSSVLVAGCLVTVNSTADLPRSDAVPSLGNFAPTCTSAMSSSKIGAFPEAVPPRTTARASWSTRSVESTPRTMYSLPYSYNTPPFAFRFISRVTVMISFSVTP